MKSFVANKIIEVFEKNRTDTINADYIDMKRYKLENLDDRQALDWADLHLDQKHFVKLLEILFPVKCRNLFYEVNRPTDPRLQDLVKILREKNKKANNENQDNQ